MKEEKVNIISGNTKSDEKLYLKSQQDAGFKVGDKVKVTRKAESFESGWTVSWESPMNNAVGNCGIVRQVIDDGICLQFEGSDEWYVYPYFVLEKLR